MAVSNPHSCAARFLQLELKKIHSEPVEGFRVSLPEDSDLSTWDVSIFGPPDTLYEGGYFKAKMKFPNDYPYSPPKFCFLTKMWHPNIYENGQVCISILHPPTDDPSSGELPSERWNPTQNVRTILLSIISLLNEPNINSPANVDASISFRNWKEGKDKDYETRVRRQVAQTKEEAFKDNVTVPITVAEYCVTKSSNGNTSGQNDNDCLTETDFYDEDCVEDYDDDDEEDDDEDDDEEDEDVPYKSSRDRCAEDSGNNSET